MLRCCCVEVMNDFLCETVQQINMTTDIVNCNTTCPKV